MQTGNEYYYKYLKLWKFFPQFLDFPQCSVPGYLLCLCITKQLIFQSQKCLFACTGYLTHRTITVVDTMLESYITMKAQSCLLSGEYPLIDYRFIFQ